jgi:hypothetical protein
MRTASPFCDFNISMKREDLKQGFAPHSFPAHLDKEIACCYPWGPILLERDTKMVVSNVYLIMAVRGFSAVMSVRISVHPSPERRTRNEG